MNIGEVIKTLKAEVNFGKTQLGRSVSERAISSLQAAIDDTKNYDVEAIKCLNCKIITSSVLTPKGCVNCGAINLTTNIDEGDIL